MPFAELLSQKDPIISDKIRELFSSDFIEALLLEVKETSDIERRQLLKIRLDLQKTQNIEKLTKLENDLKTVELNINSLSNLLNQHPEAPQIEQAKQAVNESMKLASVFANEKDYETHRGIRYQKIKEHYQKQIYPEYNAVLLRTNQFLKQKEAEMVDRLFSILSVILNDENIRTFWRRQVANSPVTDGSKVNNFSVPRGIYKARLELNKLNEDGSNKLEVLKWACLRMLERLSENDNEKPTTALYSAIGNFLNGNYLAITEDKLNRLITILEQEMFGSLSKSLEVLDFSKKQSVSIISSL